MVIAKQNRTAPYVFMSDRLGPAFLSASGGFLGLVYHRLHGTILMTTLSDLETKVDPDIFIKEAAFVNKIKKRLTNKG